MKVRSGGVRRVWDCMLCTCVSEEGGDGEDAGSETPSLLSYTLRYVSLAELSTLCRVKVKSHELSISFFLIQIFFLSLRGPFSEHKCYSELPAQ